MTALDPSLTIGIEEEYLLVEPDTLDLAARPPRELMRACRKKLGKSVTPEFLQSQIEIGTPVCRNIAEARKALTELREGIITTAEEFDLKVIAASTHPFASWERQVHTPKERYRALARDMQGAARRLLICGMHVHCCIEDEDLRIDLMNQVSYFLPHILALSTSSPFWQGQNMGMRSFRLSVFDSMPRTGIPEHFNDQWEYQRLLDEMKSAGVIKDGTMLWWDIRPSARFPTLEMRISDICSRLDDALSIAAIYQALLRMLTRLRRANQRWRIYPTTLIRENRWLAQRHGVQGKLIDLGRGELVEFGQLLDEILELIEEDATALDSTEEVEYSREIVRLGTSADRQLEHYLAAREAGAKHEDALRQVVTYLIEETRAGIC